MATGCSLPRPVVQEPLGCCLAASHLTAPLMMASVLSSTMTSSLGTSGTGAAAGSAARRVGERRVRTDSAAIHSFFFMRVNCFRYIIGSASDVWVALASSQACQWFLLQRTRFY